MYCRSNPGATPSGKRRPILTARPWLSPHCLLNCGGMRPAATAKARAERTVSARRRCGARRSERETRNPGQRPGRRLGGQTETPRLHVSTVFRAVSGSSLLVVPRSSPATNHVLCASPHALASALVFPVLFLYPREVA